MSVGLTEMDYALKTLYPKGVANEVYADNPLLAFMPKDTTFSGRNRVIDVIYGDTQGRSANIAKAQANVGSHSGIAFTITRAKDYAYAVFDRETMKATSNNEGAVVDAVKTEMKSAISIIRNSLAHSVWGSGSGSIGKVGTIGTGSNGATTSQIILSDVNQHVNFEKNKVVAVASDDGAGAGVRAGTLKVSAVDRLNGIITFTTTVLGGISGALANDFIFTDGDYGGKMTGVAAWNPWTVPGGSDSFWGVNRSVDTQRLSGIRFDGSTMSFEEALVNAAEQVSNEEANPSHGFMHWKDLSLLKTALGTRKIYEDTMSPSGIGFRAVVLDGPKGPLRLYSDRNATRGFARILDMSTWKLHSLGEAPEVIDEDGLKVRRIIGTDTFGAELAYYGQVACEAPGKNSVVALAAG